MYCLNRVGSSLSATYTKGDAYYTLLFSEIRSTLYVEKSEKGAMALPAQGEAYEALVETTVTQGYSKNINGMTYVIRLADNSFIVVDGGYVEDASNLYKTLKKLSGKESGIRIRAWIISHSHNDHYPAFGAFGDSYADKVNLECVMYAPVVEEKTGDKYFNGAILDDIAKYDGAKAVTVHAGMVFKFADVDFEILNTCEYIYKDYETLDLNESSTVCRVKNDEGSVIFLGDCYSKVSRFMIDTYGDGLKTEMMQVSHHGVEQATVELYDIISPSLAFWPCDGWLLAHERGTTTKQYLLQKETIYEHVIHGYGNATRPLSYKAESKETLQLINDSLVVNGNGVDNVRVEDGAIKYEVADVTDPFGTEGYKTVFAGSIANIKAANLNRDFTAVGYIAYFDGEAWNYIYSDTEGTRNVSDVAYAAYTDIAFEEAAGYTNEIVGAGDTLKGAYSPYTEVQRAVLRALIVEINIKDNFGGDIFAD
jgi:metal-dependent hydrolase (beta-lactamase superfamily II)